MHRKISITRVILVPQYTINEDNLYILNFVRKWASR